ncbi:MAG: hypothetical protein L0Y57_05870 [Beijerinckiaceae bacterium]|nr:hypothetical protein [Beijerinckiaceae bacterium]
MASRAKGPASAAILNVSTCWTLKIAVMVSLFAFLWYASGAAYAGASAVSTYHRAFGNAADVFVAETGYVLAALDSKKDSRPAGIQVFSLASGYANPCGGRKIINFERLGIGITSVDGIQIFPDRYLQIGTLKKSIGAAVEQQGAEFLVADLRTCAIDKIGAVNVQQPPVETSGCGGANQPQCAPGTFNLATASKFLGFLEYAFVANEYGKPLNPSVNVVNGKQQHGTVGIISVIRDFSGRFTQGTGPLFLNRYIYVPGANTIPGVTISHNGKYLYVVNEGTADGTYPRGSRYYKQKYHNPTGIKNGDLATQSCVNEYGYSENKTRNGVLTIIDVDKAISGWGQLSIIQTIAAGCSPVRVVERADGKYIFVATRGGNPINSPAKPSGNPIPAEPPPGSVGRILVFDVSRLAANPNSALVNVIRDSGGTQPVGMTLLDNNRMLAVANSNRYSQTGKTGITSVAIFDVRNPATVKRPEVVCRSPNPFSFPRGVTSDGTSIFVANFGTNISGKNFGGALQVITFNDGPASSCTVGPYPAAPN